MSNCRPVRLTPLALVLIPAIALSQSAATLEAVRVHRADALELAQAELATCLSASAAPSTSLRTGDVTDAGSPADAGVAAAPACARKLSLLVGFLALASGDAAFAAKQLSAYPGPSNLTQVHGYYLGEALFYTRDCAAAAKAFERAQKGAPPWLLSRLRTRLGETYLACNQAVLAAPLLEKAAPERDTPELYWQRSLARRLTGNLDGERADLKVLALRFPAHPYAKEALDKLASSKKPVLLTLDERLVRAKGLLDAQDPDAALAELELADKQKLPRGASAKAWVAFVRAQAYFALKDAEAAEKQLQISSKGQGSVQAEVLMLRARRALHDDDHKGALKYMTEVDKRFPREVSADDAGFLTGWLLLQDGRYADSVKALETFEKKHPTSRKRDEAFWWRSLALISSGQYAQAKQTLDQLSALFSRSPLVPQARYWAVRCQQLAAPKPELALEATAAQYEAIINIYPGSFYAVLAAERLRELGKAPPPLFPNPPQMKAVKPPRDLEPALALAEVGLFRDASEEAQSRLLAVRTPDKALEYGQALQSVGEFGHAHALAARLLWGVAYGGKDPEALALLYPRAWGDAVTREATKAQLDPMLTWAIMRRESLFRPEVLSAANARGLMQIIPPTARGIAKEIGEREPDPDELYSPELSVHFASWYLAALQKRFGHVALTAAAYNGGPPAVARWQKERGALPLDLFVEEIPFKETRGYVKQVTADYVIYGTLYGKKAEENRVSLALPAASDAGVNF
jgi:soluble lytic murein transglycosylase